TGAGGNRWDQVLATRLPRMWSLQKDASMNAAGAVRQSNLSGRIVLSHPSKTVDAAFKILTWSMAMMVFVLVVVIGWELFKGSGVSLKKFGFGFLVHSDWDPVNNDF